MNLSHQSILVTQELDLLQQFKHQSEMISRLNAVQEYTNAFIYLQNVNTR